MQQLTLYSALIGGTLIGLSAVLLLWLYGRIAGISGFIHALLPPQKGDVSWRVLFLVGMVIGGFSYFLLPTIHFEFRTHYPWWLSLLAGILVGAGTRIGSGCTSGHGVCGISRLSIRSIIATLIFMVFGVATVYLIKHVFQVGM